MTDPKPTSIPAITAEDLADSPFVSADGATSTDSATTVSDGTESAGTAPEPTATTPVPFPDETEPTQEASGTIISTDPVSTEPEPAPTDGADVDPTVSTAPSSETPSADETVEIGSSDPEPITSGAESSAPSPSPSPTDAEEPTPIFDSTVEETGTDPSPSPEASGTTSSDSSTSPSDASTPESPATTSPEGDDEPTPDATPSNSAGEADPTGTGTVIGKDGAGPTETQPSIPLEQADGSTLNTGPGVPADVSLSPTAAGGFTSDEDEGPLSTDPVFTEPEEPEEEPAPVRSFGTPIDPTFEAAVTGYTPRFRAVLRPNGVIEVQRVDWIGPEVLTVDVDDVDELAGLLQGLAAKQG